MTCEYLYKNECYNETPPTPGSSFGLCELSVVDWTGFQNEDNTDHVLIEGFLPHPPTWGALLLQDR